MRDGNVKWKTSVIDKKRMKRNCGCRYGNCVVMQLVTIFSHSGLNNAEQLRAQLHQIPTFDVAQILQLRIFNHKRKILHFI